MKSNDLLSVGSGLLGVTVLAFIAMHGSGFAQESARKGKSNDKATSPIEEKKQKGFDGVDFSYDVFGAPPGQDPQKIADDVMAKDKAEKPDVMARQKKLLRDRYQVDCKTARVSP